jgi:metallo-beta-lactamase class B
MNVPTLFFALLCFVQASTSAKYAPANAEWNRPVEPFRIVGNVYYVGASDVSAFLITTPQGHILLDTGFRETVPMLESSIRKLGFRVEDIRLLLASHAHYDHAGGMADLKAKTGARMLANPREAELLRQGGRGDFAFGDRYAFPPVVPDGEFHDGETIRLGGMVLTPHFTPGHTKGCTSYSARVREGARVFDVVFPCSLTAPGYQLVSNTQYPGIVTDFETSFAKLGALACDVFVGGHSWDFGLDAKRERLKSGAGVNPFVDPGGYKDWLERSRTAFRHQYAEQQQQRKR